MKKFIPFIGLILLLPIFVIFFIDIFALEVSGLANVGIGIFPDFPGVVENGNIPIIIHSIFIIITALLTLLLMLMHIFSNLQTKKARKNTQKIIKYITYALIASIVILFASSIIALFVNELIVGLAYYRLVPAIGFYLQIPILIGSIATLFGTFKN